MDGLNSQKLWEEFAKTGRIEDYLNYKSSQRGTNADGALTTGSTHFGIREDMRFGTGFSNNADHGTYTEGNESR